MTAKIKTIEGVMRSRVMQAGVFAVACGVAYKLAVEPRFADARQQAVQLAAMESRASEYQSLRPQQEKLEGSKQVLENALADMRGWTAISGDSAAIYDGFSRLGAAHGVRIDNVSPASGRGGGSIAIPAEQLGPRPRVGEKDKVFRYDGRTEMYRLQVTGTFEAVARFIGACERELGAAKVMSFRLAPASGAEANEGADLIVATLDTVHLQLERVEHVEERRRGSRRR